jgi:hypothetical protein
MISTPSLKVCKLLTDDIEYNFQKMIAHPNYHMTETGLKDHLIGNLTTLFCKSRSNIHDFNLPRKTSNLSCCQSNHFIDEELCDDVDSLLSDFETMISQLNNEQLQAFNTIIEAVLANKSDFFLCIWLWYQ